MKRRKLNRERKSNPDPDRDRHRNSDPDEDLRTGEEEEQEPVELPISGELDLHLFSPKEVKDLVPEYLRNCREKGIYSVRVVHGKGKGVLLQTVHTVLDRLDIVESYQLDSGPRGGWGATLVELKR